MHSHYIYITYSGIVVSGERAEGSAQQAASADKVPVKRRSHSKRWLLGRACALNRPKQLPEPSRKASKLLEHPLSSLFCSIHSIALLHLRSLSQ